MTQILLVDDHPSVREGTKLMLEGNENIRVTTCGSASEALQLLEKQCFDVILVDYVMPEMNGIQLTTKALRICPNAKILIYTGYDIKQYFNQFMECGVAGLISKTATKEQMLDAIRCALRGEAIIPISLLRELRKDQIFYSESTSELLQLTPRETSILMEVAKGKTNKEIAGTMHMSQRSLEYVLSQIFRKLNVHSRIEAVAKAKKMGMILLD